MARCSSSSAGVASVVRWSQVGEALCERWINADRDDVIHGVCTWLTT